MKKKDIKKIEKTVNKLFEKEKFIISWQFRIKGKDVFVDIFFIEDRATCIVIEKNNLKHLEDMLQKFICVWKEMICQRIRLKMEHEELS